MDGMDKLKDYFDMMAQIKAPPDLIERVMENAVQHKQAEPEESYPDLDGIDDFCLDDYRDPSAVIWKRKGGFGVDYDWSITHFAEISNLVAESGLPVTVCDGGRDIVVVNPI